MTPAAAPVAKAAATPSAAAAATPIVSSAPAATSNTAVASKPLSGPIAVNTEQPTKHQKEQVAVYLLILAFVLGFIAGKFLI